MLEELSELVPAIVRLKGRVMRLRVDLVAQEVDRRHAGIAAARDVESGQVEREPEQIVPQCPGDEFVDLASDLVRRALNKFARGVGTRVQVCKRIRESVEEGNFVINSGP